MPRNRIGIPAVVEDETRSGLRQVNRSIDRASDRIEQRLRQAGTRVAGFSQELRGLGSYLPGGFAGGVGVAVGAVGTFALSLLNTADELDNASAKSGLSAEAIQTYGLIAEEAGSSQEKLVQASQDLQQRLAQVAETGSGEAAQAIDSLGLSVEGFLALSPDEQFAELRDRLSEVEDPARRLFLAQRLMGEGARELNGVLSITSDEFVAVRERATELGVQLTNEEVRRLDEYEERMQTLQRTVKNTATDAFFVLTDALTNVGHHLLFYRDLLIPTASAAAALAAEQAELAARYDADVAALGPLLTDTETYATLLDGSTAIIDSATGAVRAKTEALYEDAAATASAGGEAVTTGGGMASLALHIRAVNEQAARGTLRTFTQDIRDVREEARLAAVQLRNLPIAHSLFGGSFEGSRVEGLYFPDAFDQALDRARQPTDEPAGGGSGGTRPPALRLGDYLADVEGFDPVEFDVLRRYGPNRRYGSTGRRINLSQDISGLTAEERTELILDVLDAYQAASLQADQDEIRRRREETVKREEQAQRDLARRIGRELDRTRPP